MILHHIGYVFKQNQISHFNKLYKLKITDHKQQNYIYFSYNNKLKIWFEYLIPINKDSTVYKHSKKNNKKPHHFGFWVNNLKKETKKLTSNNFILIKKFKINVPAFGGLTNTAFFFKDNKIIELLSSE